MAVPIWNIPKTAAPSDCSSFGLADLTVYGGSYTVRNTFALVMFLTRTDKNGVRTLQSITPNTTDYTAVASWIVNSTDDGLIEKIFFAVNLWGSGPTYQIGDIVFDTVDLNFYKCTVSNTNFVPHSNLAKWSLQPVGNLYANELTNTSTQMVIVDQSDINSCRIEKKINSEYQRIADNFISGVNDVPEYNQADILDSLLQSAYSALNNGRPYEADEIIQGITNYVLDYGATN